MSPEIKQQVDFYLISNAINDGQFKLASRLASKLIGLHKKVLLVTSDKASSQRLDTLMWTFSDTSFVPHDDIGDTSGTKVSSSATVVREEKDAPTPTVSSVTIAELDLISMQALQQVNYDVLINLCAKVPIIIEHFGRIIEIIAADDNAKTTGRLRYKDYQQKNIEIVTHQLEI